MNKSSIKSKATPDSQAWWLKPLTDTQAALATDEAGLSSTEARLRLIKFGPNLFRDHQQRSLILQFLARFKNPLVILLLVASAIFAFTGEMTNFVIITVMVLLSVTLDFVQEHRAGKAAESLRQSVSVRARVIRDGKAIDIPVTEVVPGDLTVLSAGDMVPADGLVLEAQDLFDSQADITYKLECVSYAPKYSFVSLPKTRILQWLLSKQSLLCFSLHYRLLSGQLIQSLTQHRNRRRLSGTTSFGH
ncbi:MAG: cation-transporting P-type ATPase [Methylococcales bacterium]